MDHAVVADAETANFALFLGFDESFPGTFSTLASSVWSVDEHEVDVSQSTFLQGFLDLDLGVLVVQFLGWDLAGEEYIFARNSWLVVSVLALW